MKTILRAGAVLACLSIGAAALSLDDSVTLRLAFTKGESLRYRMTQEQTVENEMMGAIENSSAFVFRQDVTEVAADGTATLDVRYEALRLDNGGPMPLFYDSSLTGDAAKRNDPTLAKMLGPMIDAPMVMKIEPNGRVAELRGVKEMLDKAFPGDPNPMDPKSMLKEIFNEDALRKLVEINVYPTEPIAPGHVWKRHVDQKLPMMGTLQLDFENTFVGVEERAGKRCAKIALAGKMSLKPEPQAAMPMSVTMDTPSLSGTMFLSLDAGRVIEAQIDSTMDMTMEFGEGEQTMAMEMSIAATQRMVLIASDAPLFE